MRSVTLLVVVVIAFCYRFYAKKMRVISDVQQEAFCVSGARLGLILKH